MIEIVGFLLVGAAIATNAFLVERVRREARESRRPLECSRMEQTVADGLKGVEQRLQTALKRPPTTHSMEIVRVSNGRTQLAKRLKARGLR